MPKYLHTLLKLLMYDLTSIKISRSRRPVFLPNGRFFVLKKKYGTMDVLVTRIIPIKVTRHLITKMEVAFSPVP